MGRPAVPNPCLLIMECLGVSSFFGFTVGDLIAGGGGSDSGDPSASFSIFYFDSVIYKI